MIYTFYSYKGGVGQTMTLANVADLLHQRGLKVIVVDWELESPELERYFPGAEDALAHPGLVDLILDFKKIMRQPPEKAEGKDELPLPDLKEYLVHVPTDDGPPLMLLLAGKRAGADFEQYARTVRFFDWKDFYKNWEGELFFKWLREELGKLADVVLINSGPGISEIGIVCTQQMADAVVLFCGSSYQSLDGTLKVASNLAGTQSLTARRGQPVRVIIVPARIDERAEMQLVRDFKQDFVKGCKPYLPEDKLAQEQEYFWNLRVPNVPRFAFKEELVVGRSGAADETQVVSAFTKITEAMARLAPPESKLYQLCGDKLMPVARTTPPPPKGVEPYRGLDPFLEEHASLFFGRAAKIKELLHYVEKGGIVAVIGSSGSGKSSLVQAGLLPIVRQSEQWKIVTLKPGDDPFAALADAFAPSLRDAGEVLERAEDQDRLAATLADEEDGLGQVVQRVLARHPPGARVLLIVDQFEELFTLAHEGQQHTFLMRLVSAVETGLLTVVLTLRSDFYEDCEKFQPFFEAVQRQTVTLDQMTREGLKEAVIKPAELMGVTFEAGLADRILKDVGTDSGNLPLLQFALTRLWQERDGGRLTHQVYTGIGEVEGALARRAETVYMSFTKEKRRIARRILMRLVQLNEGGRNTRWRATFAELGEPVAEVQEIVKLLSEARLLVVREADKQGIGRLEEQIDMAHETLIQNWKRLQRLLNKTEEFLLWRQHLRSSIVSWKKNKKDPAPLLRGTLLQTALDFQGRYPDALNRDEKDYIAQSRNQKKRRALKWCAGIAVAIILVLVCGLAVWVALKSKNDTITAGGYYARGREYKEKGDNEAALDNYNKAIQLSPEFRNAYLDRASLYHRIGGAENYRNAIADYTKYIDLLTRANDYSAHDMAVAYDGRGQAYYKLDDFDNALADFSQALEKDRSFAQAWYDLGRVSAKRGQVEPAINNYTQAIANDANFYQAYFDRGEAYYGRWKGQGRQDDLQRAFDDFNKARELNADAVEPDYYLGLIYADRQDYKEAVEYFTRALNRNHDYAAAYDARGQAWASLGQAEKALEDYKEAAGRGYRPAFYRLGMAYQAKGEYDQAINALEVAINSEPNNDAAFWHLGEAYAQKGDYEAAIKNYNRSIELKPDQLDVYFSRGVAYAKIDKKDEAINDFLKFISPSAQPEKRYEATLYLEQLDFRPTRNYVQIYLHYNETMDAGLLEQVKSALRENGFGRVNATSSTSDIASVRYFQKPFKDHARAIRDIIKKAFESKINLQNFGVFKFPESGRRDTYGWIEVWLPAGRPAEPAKPTPEPSPSPTQP